MAFLIFSEKTTANFWAIKRNASQNPLVRTFSAVAAHFLCFLRVGRGILTPELNFQLRARHQFCGARKVRDAFLKNDQKLALNLCTDFGLASSNSVTCQNRLFQTPRAPEFGGQRGAKNRFSPSKLGQNATLRRYGHFEPTFR